MSASEPDEKPKRDWKDLFPLCKCGPENDYWCRFCTGMFLTGMFDEPK